MQKAPKAFKGPLIQFSIFFKGMPNNLNVLSWIESARLHIPRPCHADGISSWQTISGIFGQCNSLLQVTNGTNTASVTASPNSLPTDHNLSKEFIPKDTFPTTSRRICGADAVLRFPLLLKDLLAVLAPMARKMKTAANAQSGLQSWTNSPIGSFNSRKGGPKYFW